MSVPVFVGIDVSKDTLDIAVLPSGERWQTPYAEASFPLLVDRLLSLAPQLVLVEATGGLQDLLVAALAQAGLVIQVVNPRQVRDFARALGQLAKTDAIDAHVLALFAQRVPLDPRPLPDAQTQALAALVARRRQLMEMPTMEKNRTARAPGGVRKNIQRHIDWLSKEIGRVEGELEDFLRLSPIWREKEDLLKSVPGIGDILAATLIANLPELGTLGRKQVAKLVGVAPFNHDSGTHKGKRAIGGGRAHVRAALYMAALVAVRHNLLMQALYQRLLDAKKPKKVALVACMRKLLTILNAMLKHKTPWHLSPKVIYA